MKIRPNVWTLLRAWPISLDGHFPHLRKPIASFCSHICMAPLCTKVPTWLEQLLVDRLPRALCSGLHTRTSALAHQSRRRLPSPTPCHSHLVSSQLSDRIPSFLRSHLHPHSSPAVTHIKLVCDLLSTPAPHPAAPYAIPLAWKSVHPSFRKSRQTPACLSKRVCHELLASLPQLVPWLVPT